MCFAFMQNWEYPASRGSAGRLVIGRVLLTATWWFKEFVIICTDVHTHTHTRTVFYLYSSIMAGNTWTNISGVRPDLLHRPVSATLNKRQKQTKGDRTQLKSEFNVSYFGYTIGYYFYYFELSDQPCI